ncbi:MULTISPECIES: histidine phosphatase family protein [Streptomyces]|uniref:Histidine phosphatase family protein n=1 Tax=Streptomyces caniscabiei TaxID=2746961 RepID=A0ABU4MY74_9ACTN|nr:MULTISPECIES: histidine phosphatase family protein [Streptomyces]MBE4733385.1 histidine phosphatase family protein [Streptomyces caniscabiei]MBE4754563.1 histidine phosphatase family protein [Streptomyces caniscabiei]MBE4768616.1 histidine phosphatase family protein [Streptomyces caniscabiei]MBE4781880.1 histidine phosphatase family protein [Streptomyces caniscabiei]MBE4793170.1 histidine phosphatase family protein [Streptomyces caniscabiei]
MTELLLIRHGLPLAGVYDPGLSPEGIAQAERLAAWLRAEDIDGLYTSPFRRARETVAPLERLTGMTATVLDDLREWDTDVSHPYTPPEQIGADDPRAAALAEGRYEDFVPELDWDAFRARAARAMDTILDAHPGGRVAAVCHGGITNTYLATLLGLPRMFWFHPGYTSICRVRRLPGGRIVPHSVNETAHMIADRAVDAVA